MSKRPLLVTASHDETVRYWDPIDQRQLETITIKESQINVLTITPDGHQLAAAGCQTLSLFDCQHLGNQPLQAFNVHERNVTTMGFSRDGTWMYTGSEDTTAKVWDLRSSTLVCQRILQLTSTVNSIALHPNNVELIVADSAGGVFLWDIRSNRDDSLVTKLNYTEFVTNLDVDCSGKQVVAITNKGNCFLYSTHPDQMLIPDVHGMDCELAPDPFNTSNTHLPMDQSSEPRTHMRLKFNAHRQYGLKCKFTPDGNHVLTTAGDDIPKLWDINNIDPMDLKPKREYPGEVMIKNERPYEVNMKWVWDCAFTNDGKNLFTASSDGILRMFDVDSMLVKRKYHGHSRGITAMAFWDPTC